MQQIVHVIDVRLKVESSIPETMVFIIELVIGPDHEAFMMDVVIRQGLVVLQLLDAEEEHVLLTPASAPRIACRLLLLDLGPHLLDGVGGHHGRSEAIPPRVIIRTRSLDVQEVNWELRDDRQVQVGLLLDVVVAERVVVRHLLALEDQVLQLGRDVPLVLDLVPDILDGLVAHQVQGEALSTKLIDVDRQDLHNNKSRYTDQPNCL